MKYNGNFCPAAAILLVMFAASRLHGGVTLTTLVSFSTTNGANPASGLLEDADGSLYGTTYNGGLGDLGTIYRISPGGQLTNLISFNGTNGSHPYAGLARGSNGAYYGATAMGGTNGGFGTIYALTTNTFDTLFSFNGTNGSFPQATLLPGPDGYLYGTTETGGTNGGFGTAFRISTAGVLTTLYSFDGIHGAGPYAALALGGDGNFYGTTTAGGTNGGLGTVFKLTPAGSLTSLLSFNGTNGANPYGALALGPDGNLYGTTTAGGSNGLGTVFRVSTNGALNTIAAFTGTNGANPYSGLVPGTDGNLYGTTQLGGSNNDGTAFAVSPLGNLALLVSFDFFSTGDLLRAALMQSKDGNFYGATYNGGGATRKGTVFRLSVPLPPTIRKTTPSGGQLQLEWTAVSGQSYQLKWASDPGQTTWTNLGAPILATNGVVSTSDSLAPAPAHRYYRVLVVP